MPATENDSAPNLAKPARLLSLDVFRGLTILAMILVNNPGDWGSLYGPLGHADWHGFTPTDAIFPFFLFMVGTAMAFSLKKYVRESTDSGEPRAQAEVDAAVYWRIFRRTLLLIALGLLLSGCGQIIRLLLGQGDSLSFATLRLPGVLQRIGLCYLAASVMVLHLRPRWLLMIGSAFLIGYCLLLNLLPSEVAPGERLTPTGNLVRVVDLAVLGANHMWTRATSEPTDPEGLLSTLPAIVTTLLGYGLGLFLRKQDKPTLAVVGKMLLAGAVLVALGYVWDQLGLPINKKLWTSSFVLFSAGWATLCLAFCYLLFDVLGESRSWLQRIAVTFQMVGVNAILVFVGSGLLARTLGLVKVGRQSAKGWFYENAITSWIGDPKLASLTFALVTVAFWWAVAAFLWRRGWSLRV